MMTKKMTPHTWAFNITGILNTICLNSDIDRFPVDVAAIAKEYSKQIDPDDPITLVKGEVLDNFDGGLYKAPPHKKGWGIIYNNTIESQGRINFTLAHEFGHYLLHRKNIPEKIECGSNKLIRWDSTYGQIEHQANVFASNLLMPLDDYRQQIDPARKVNFDIIGFCTERYEVSLIAATLRWIEFTECRAAIVVSRDGFILWGRASDSAYKSGIFFKTVSQTIPLPDGSLASHIDLNGMVNQRQTMELTEKVWFKEPCEETVIFSENYDFVISLLQFESF